ncbi:MAG TPA: helix-turn-helix transcriptional regulator [Longimicrobiales bacterium]|nr:helix-turn-helix transcriptional regulator [Longimicrobiales bacterium]
MHTGMRLYFTHFFRSYAYRKADKLGRRLIEIRFAVALVLRRERRRRGISQRQLARMLNSAQSTISRVERASPRVSLDLAIRAFLVLGLDDAAISAAFNPDLRPEVRQLRARTSGPFYR